MSEVSKVACVLIRSLRCNVASTAREVGCIYNKEAGYSMETHQPAIKAIPARNPNKLCRCYLCHSSGSKQLSADLGALFPLSNERAKHGYTVCVCSIDPTGCRNGHEVVRKVDKQIESLPKLERKALCAEDTLRCCIMLVATCRKYSGAGALCPTGIIVFIYTSTGTRKCTKVSIRATAVPASSWQNKVLGRRGKLPVERRSGTDDLLSVDSTSPAAPCGAGSSQLKRAEGVLSGAPRTAWSMVRLPPTLQCDPPFHKTY